MNTTHPLRKLGLALCLIGGLAASGSGFAQSGAIHLENAVFQEETVTATDGKTTTKLVPAARVAPGDEVVYEIAYRNNGKDTASEVEIDNPLPEEVVFVSASTTPTEVSVDGGKAFGQLAELSVVGPDGTTRAARAEDITNLRWVVPTLAGGASGKVVFRARVR